MFGFFWIFYVSRFVPIMLAQPAGVPRLRATGLIFLLALFPAGVTAGVAAMWDKFRPWSKDRIGYYLLEIFLSVAPINLTFTYVAESPLFSDIKGLGLITAPPNPIFIAFNFLLVVLLLAALNSRESKIQRRLDKAAELVSKLEKDSRLLVLAESELKNQVSQFLHDRVQSSLMVASMRLQKMIEIPEEISAADLKTIIQELEEVRMQDLRLAIESLSPNLEANELQSLITALMPRSLESSTLKVSVPDESSKFSPELKMAIFKISEQAILNALVHGSATQIEVNLTQVRQTSWLLSVKDDGMSSPLEQSKPGLGTAIIDSWTRIIGGTKRIDAQDGRGYTLEISFTQAA